MNADEGAEAVLQIETGEIPPIIQSRQAVCPDSLNPRETGQLNEDLVGNHVFTEDDNKAQIVVDFGEENRDAQMPSPAIAFAPQQQPSAAFMPQMQPQPQVNPQTSQSLVDTQFMTNMMKTHVRLMQKQLEDGFGLIANKMKTLETKLSDNDKQIRKVQTGINQEIQTKEQKDKENMHLFENLQESIALQ